MHITSICPVKPISEHRDRLHWNVKPLMINLCNTSHLWIDRALQIFYCEIEGCGRSGVWLVEPADITLDAVD